MGLVVPSWPQYNLVVLRMSLQCREGEVKKGWSYNGDVIQGDLSMDFHDFRISFPDPLLGLKQVRRT